MISRTLAVDWSGAVSGSRQKIWLAEAVGDQLVALDNGRSREELAAHLACEARLLSRAATSEDTFDAAVSALVLARHVESLVTSGRPTDRFTCLEGMIWRPAEDVLSPRTIRLGVRFLRVQFRATLGGS